MAPWYRVSMRTKQLAAVGIVCLSVGAVASRDAGAQIAPSKAGLTDAPKVAPPTAPTPTPAPTPAPVPVKVIDDGSVVGSSPAPSAPFVWFKFDNDLKDTTGRLKPLAENYEWNKTSSFGPGRNGQAKTWQQWSQSMTAPHLVGDVGTFFVRDAFSVALAVRGVYWGAAKEVARATGKICASNTLFSIRGLSIYVYGCGAAATTGFLKVQMIGRDGDKASLGGAMYVDQGVAIAAGRWNDIFVSFDPKTHKLSAWLNGVLAGSAAIMR